MGKFTKDLRNGWAVEKDGRMFVKEAHCKRRTKTINSDPSSEMSSSKLRTQEFLRVDSQGETYGQMIEFE
jgi:hypothetical protein